MNLTKRVKHVWADIVWMRRKKATTTHTHTYIQKGKNNQKTQTNKPQNHHMHKKFLPSKTPKQTNKKPPNKQKQQTKNQTTKKQNKPQMSSLDWPFANLIEH